ncbi:MAG: sporulation protein YabP [Oscillospiraceae bacterium]|nr:sporulation protein YabP [Oscillospiraceae bacterium]
MEEALPHKLQLEERRKLTVTGVTEIMRFEETAVVLQTSLGLLIVQGQGLQLKQLSQDAQVIVEGSICALAYQEQRTDGFWRRLLR